MQISFITPVGPNTPFSYLERSYQELTRLNSTIDWEWALQLDGSAQQFDLSNVSFLQDDQVQIEYNRENKGVAQTRNNALARCTKEYCLSLDSDDLIIPEGIEAILREIEAIDKIDFAIGECLDLFPSGKIIRRFDQPKLNIGRLRKWDLLTLWLTEGSLFFQPGPVVYRTSALKVIGGWPYLPSVKDFEIISTLLHVEGRGEGYYSACDLYLYRQHPNQNTRTTRDDESALEIIKLILTKNPDSTEAIAMLAKIEAGDNSMVSISKFFSAAWKAESETMRLED